MYKGKAYLAVLVIGALLGSCGYGQDLTPFAVSTADSYYNGMDYPTYMIQDGNVSTVWDSGSQTVEHWIILNWQRSVQITSVYLRFSDTQYGYYSPKNYKIQKMAGGKWVTIHSVSGQARGVYEYTYTPAVSFEATKLRIYFEIPTQYEPNLADAATVTAMLADCRVYGDFSNNMSLEASVAADSYYWQSGYPETNVLDGNDTSEWVSGSSTIEHWISLTWTKEVRINSIYIKFSDAQYGFYRPQAYKIQKWTGSSWENLQVVTGQGRDVEDYYYQPAEPFIATAVRLYFDIPTQYTPNLNTYYTVWACLPEFTVEGKYFNDIAPGAALAADSYYLQSGYPASSVWDSNDATEWVSGSSTIEHWMSLTWNKVMEVNSVYLRFSDTQYGYYRPQAYKIQKWTGVAWETVKTVSGQNRGVDKLFFVPSASFTTTALRLYFDIPTQYTPNLNTYYTVWACLPEFKVDGRIYAKQSSSSTPAADSYYYQTAYPASNVIDGSDSTEWYSASTTSNHWISLSWNKEIDIKSIYLRFSDTQYGFYRPQAYKLQKWDGSSWVNLQTVTGQNRGVESFLYTATESVAASKVRLYYDIPTQYSPDPNIAYTLWACLPEFSVTGSESGVPYTVLSSIGSDRGSGFNMSNKIVSKGWGDSRRTYVTWLDRPNTQSLTTSIKIKEFNPVAKTWASTVTLGSGTDNHAGGSLVLDKIGRLHCVYGSHNDNFKYRYTTSSSDMTQWSTEESFSGGTYPSLVADKTNENILHMTCREYFSGTYPTLVYYKRELSGGSYQWVKKLSLVTPGITQPWYARYGNALGIDKSGRLHLAYNILIEERDANGQVTGEVSRTAAYMRSDNGGTTWRKASGNILTLPVTPQTGDTLMQGNLYFLEVGNISTDGNNNPWITLSDSNAGKVYLYHHNGSSWSNIDLTAKLIESIPGAMTESDSVVSITKNNEVFVFISYFNYVGGWGTSRCESALLISSVSEIETKGSGAQFRIVQISPKDSTVADWCSAIECNTGHNVVDTPALAYTHGDWNNVQTEVRFVDLKPNK